MGGRGAYISTKKFNEIKRRYEYVDKKYKEYARLLEYSNKSQYRDTFEEFSRERLELMKEYSKYSEIMDKKKKKEDDIPLF